MSSLNSVLAVYSQAWEPLRQSALHVSRAPPSQRLDMLSMSFRYAHARLCGWSLRSAILDILQSINSPGYANINWHTVLHEFIAVQPPWTNGFTPHAYRQACATPEAWDLHAAWRPWAELPDPLSCILLQLRWRSLPVQVLNTRNLCPGIPPDTQCDEFSRCPFSALTGPPARGMQSSDH